MGTRMKALFAAVLAVAVLGISGTALAAVNGPHVSLHLSGAVVQSGHAAEKPVEKTSLKRGDIVRWTIVAENDGTKPALHLAPMDRVPQGMTFLAGSAASAAPAAVQYTLDGRAWSPRPTVKVTLKNGKVETKPADPASYRAVRWVFARPLAAHERASVSFETRVL